MTQHSEALTDPKAMRALAHPARLMIVGRLSAEGSATATEVAEIVGITPSAASYHLRMLAKYGFVEDAPPRGDGRERLWKAVERRITFGVEPGEGPEIRAAKDLLTAAYRRDAANEVDRVLSTVDHEDKEWLEATILGRFRLRVDAGELLQLYKEIEKLVDPYRAKVRSREEAPEGARVAEVQVNLFPVADRPVPGLPTEDHDAT